jgi:hypothetical protein
MKDYLQSLKFLRNISGLIFSNLKYGYLPYLHLYCDKIKIRVDISGLKGGGKVFCALLISDTL